MAGRKGAEHAANLFGVLAEASRPLSAYDLLDRLRPTGVTAPLTVYRALETLIAAGKVHRIESLNAFVACRGGEHAHEGHAPGNHPPTRRNVAFAICDQCGAVEEFVDPDLFAALDRRVARARFSPVASAIEVHGLCRACINGPDHARPDA